MNLLMRPYRFRSSPIPALLVAVQACAGVFALGAASAQEPPPIPQSTAAAATPRPQSAQTPAVATLPPEPTPDDSILLGDIANKLIGQALYLRGGYLSDDLHFDQAGHLTSGSPRGSYTLCAIEITHVNLTKRHLELEGIRYGIHFVGSPLRYEDQSKAIDRVRITPKKKVVKITIDREQVVKAHEQKEAKARPAALLWPQRSGSKDDSLTYPQQAEVSEDKQTMPAKPPTAAAPVTPATAATEAGAAQEETDLGTTTSPAHATAELMQAIDDVFARGLDDRMKSAMPDFWQRYYQAAAAKTDYRPADPGVFRQNNVDTKAKLISNFEPDSNEMAQSKGVAGLALYHVVIEPDGKPGEISVARPIGFGLDENAVAAIRDASFRPATKDGKAVPVLLDLIVQFRIFSKRTAERSASTESSDAASPALPGPYSVPRK